MDELRRVARISIGRACGFAGLAILCVMMGLSYEPALAAKAGAILVTLTLLILMIKARWALTQDYRRTEMWIMLEPHQQPPEAYAQWAASTVLRDAYLWFAQYTAAVAIVLWVATILLALLMPPA